MGICQWWWFSIDVTMDLWMYQRFGKHWFEREHETLLKQQNMCPLLLSEDGDASWAG